MSRMKKGEIKICRESVPKRITEKTDGLVENKTVASNTGLWVQMIEKAYAASGLHKGKFNAENKTMNSMYGEVSRKSVAREVILSIPSLRKPPLFSFSYLSSLV